MLKMLLDKKGPRSQTRVTGDGVTGRKGGQNLRRPLGARQVHHEELPDAHSLRQVRAAAPLAHGDLQHRVGARRRLVGGRGLLRALPVAFGEKVHDLRTKGELGASGGPPRGHALPAEPRGRKEACPPSPIGQLFADRTSSRGGNFWFAAGTAGCRHLYRSPLLYPWQASRMDRLPVSQNLSPQNPAVVWTPWSWQVGLKPTVCKLLWGSGQRASRGTGYVPGGAETTAHAVGEDADTVSPWENRQEVSSPRPEPTRGTAKGTRLGLGASVKDLGATGRHEALRQAGGPS